MEAAGVTTPGEVAAAYFQAWQNGDIDHVRPLLHPEVDFVGALGTTLGFTVAEKPRPARQI